MNTATLGTIGALAGAVVGLIGVLIGQYLTERRHRQALRQTAELEEQRANRDAELEEQRANRDALLKYLEVVGQQLLTDPSKAEHLSPIIRAQTMALLEGLEPGYKRILLEFLYESNLIGPEKPGLSLQEANLERANLERANLAEANLERAHLERANLAEAYLERANLAEAYLERANLVDVNLRRANLAGAKLKETDLSGALLEEMTEEGLTQTQINEAVGNDATKLPDHVQRPAHWSKGESEKS